MRLPRWPPSRKTRAKTTGGAMTQAMKRIIVTEHQALWEQAVIWSRDCPAKLRRLQQVDWAPIFAQARRTNSPYIPRL